MSRLQFEQHCCESINLKQQRALNVLATNSFFFFALQPIATANVNLPKIHTAMISHEVRWIQGFTQW